MSNLVSKLASTLKSSSGSGSTTPRFVYKIFPSPAANSFYQFAGPPGPVAASHVFVPTPADAKDGFVHLSTADQVQGTLDRFFRGDDEDQGARQVTVLKLDYGRLSGFKVVKWEGGELDGGDS